MILVGQFAHLYVHFVSMKRMYIIVEAQGDWHSAQPQCLSTKSVPRYSTNRVSTMYHVHSNDILPAYCNLIELYSKCIALILNMWYIGGSFGTRPCLVAYPTDYFWHRIQRISECVTVRVLVRVSPSVFCFALFVSC